MVLYHGSPVADLNELKPFLSEHGKPYIYFADNPLIALLYAVKPVPKPFSFYPYGFGNDGSIVYSEYFEDAFRKLYDGKRGYLYECGSVNNAQQPTNIKGVYTCTENTAVKMAAEIDNLYEYYIAQEKSGLFRIKRFGEISPKEMNFVLDDMKNTAERYNLKNDPCNPMSVFIKEHFPTVL